MICVVLFVIVAKDTQMTKANSIVGACDFTLYDIVEQLIQQAAMTMQFAAGEKYARKNSFSAASQLSSQQVVKACKYYMTQ